ncbi:MAG: NAD(P)H-quinone oxidoreductase subunit D4, partial [Chloroflexi bacterium]|nr:NAD(P)H-quinone oxidoreductase subunit D4 [Chloroflexota bacterium]
MLSLLIFLPALGALAVVLAPAHVSRLIALVTTGSALVLSLVLLALWNPNAVGPQFVDRLPWAPVLRLEYFVGVDGLSMPMVLLTTLIGF